MKVGGEEEKIKIKVCRVVVLLLDNIEMFLIKVIVILCISEEVLVVQFKLVVKFFGLENERICRGKGFVDLLIGIDYVQMYIRQIRQIGQLVVRKMFLGLVVFGGLLGEI